ncbi:Hsp20/alpha crystallin family protein [Lutibacter sp. TH_r2]|uniref:Hsp20/alpha crystallin family protein n=1 Tax=Lutibacter sp. TH_r2 TaxID=3082083 RepID=UPI0029558E59|nr:Hsp20/alpha crystallin family protein [Lutibacter sp. TH_r2]MDV7188260.1 Hsp20/alpha crystallin family protein [Lutibacter sp. TH_r2]
MLVKSMGTPVVVPTIFDDFFKDWSLSNFSNTDTTLPAVNIRENDDEFIVEVAAPGMEKNDFKIDLDNNVLTISSERTTENNEVKDDYTRKEYSYQSFKRSFNLPRDIVNQEKIDATYSNGELKIMIPKMEEAKPKPKKLIEVH